MSPGLRASYCRPIPGTPLDSTRPPIDPSTFPKELPLDLDENASEQEKIWLKEALTQMALLVIEPFEVDWYVLRLLVVDKTNFELQRCDLAAVPNKRIQWTKKDGVWSEINVVP